VVLSRVLAEEGVYPAVDVEASISRAMPAIVEAAHREHAQDFKKLWARFQQNRDLISVGAYVPGSDEDTDRAIANMRAMRAYLQQGMDERVDNAASVLQLAALSGAATGTETRAPVATLPRRQLRMAAERG
jgi:flagellum-specific ATP synthase